jgi:signal peptidase I
MLRATAAFSALLLLRNSRRVAGDAITVVPLAVDALPPAIGAGGSPAPGPETMQPDEADAPPVEAEAPVARKKKPLWRGIAEWSLYLAFLAGALVLTPTILSSALGTPYPMAAVTSNSMWPALHKGDMVLLKGVDKPEDLSPGDIIGFKQPDGGFAIHRIVKIDGNAITTKGDANKEADPFITFDKVVGRVPSALGQKLKVRYLGYFGILLGPLFGHTTSDSQTVGEP